MNRRDALKSFAALAGAPWLSSWVLAKPAKNPKIDLMAFCAAAERYRRIQSFDLYEPFLQAGHLYATDGAVCVRVDPDGYGHVAAELIKLPPASGLAWNHDDCTGWRTLPKIDPLLASDWCLHCKGYRFLDYHECDE